MKILDMTKILVLALFLVVVVSTVAAISASEDLTLEGIKFNVPDGYSLMEQETDGKGNDKCPMGRHDIHLIQTKAQSKV